MICLLYPDRNTPPNSFPQTYISSKHPNMLDSLSSYTDLASLMASMLQQIFTTTDYAITVPFDIKSLSYFSLLKVKTLWQTKARWYWFDKACKDDKDAGTRLGTLRFLPYEIRQQIFQIVLEDYFDEVEEQLGQQNPTLKRWRYRYIDSVNRPMLQIEFEGRHCCCKRDKVPNVFDLRSYFGVRQATERLPMSLRLASPSIQPEFDCVFLSRSTFQFTCPFILHEFLDQLSPFQQSQLKCLKLSMFQWWRCASDSLTRRDQWMAACQRLPRRLKYVEMQPPHRLDDVPAFWTNRSTGIYFGQPINDEIKRITIEPLEVLCKKVSRASPRAVISWTRDVELGKEDYAALDAVLAELEPWSEEWHIWRNGTYRSK